MMVVALALAGSGVWWWQEKEPPPVELPGSACWSVLDRADLAAFGGRAHGRFDVSYPREGSHERLQPSESDQECLVGQAVVGLLSVYMRPLGELGYRSDFAPGSTLGQVVPVERLDFGADVRGFVNWNGSVRLAFRCENAVYAALGRPFLEIGTGTDDRATDPESPQARQALIDIALKLAKAAALSYPCSNPVRFPAKAPTAPTVWPPREIRSEAPSGTAGGQ
ncbi:hypothetical protein [Kitasatospora sp. NPDC090091]|uniref:hypothetical protein n=1 Tax=Kitasatospora sp. NPDC090091 TaxID=3364081 RepID=UPI0037F124C5